MPTPPSTTAVHPTPCTLQPSYILHRAAMLIPNSTILVLSIPPHALLLYSNAFVSKGPQIKTKEVIESMKNCCVFLRLEITYHIQGYICYYKKCHSYICYYQVRGVFLIFQGVYIILSHSFMIVDV